MKAIIPLLTILSLSPSFAIAQTTQLPLNDIQKAHQHIDILTTQLNKKNQQIEKRLQNDPTTLANFKDTQKNWNDFTYNECAFKAVNGKSMGKYIYTNCQINFLKQRLAKLDYYLNCQEGDLSCPVPRS